jgi:hypothetical protein
MMVAYMVELGLEMLQGSHLVFSLLLNKKISKISFPVLVPVPHINETSCPVPGLACTLCTEIGDYQA